MHKVTASSAEGDMRITIGYFALSKSPRISLSSFCTLHLVEVLDELGGLSHCVPNFSFRAPDEDKLSIAALEGGLMPSNAEDLAGLPLGCDSSV